MLIFYVSDNNVKLAWNSFSELRSGKKSIRSTKTGNNRTNRKIFIDEPVSKPICISTLEFFDRTNFSNGYKTNRNSITKTKIVNFWDKNTNVCHKIDSIKILVGPLKLLLLSAFSNSRSVSDHNRNPNKIAYFI